MISPDDDFFAAADDDNDDEPPVEHFLTEAGPEAFDRLQNLIKLPFFLLGGVSSEREVRFSAFSPVQSV